MRPTPEPVAAAASVKTLVDGLAALLRERLGPSKAQVRRFPRGEGFALELRWPAEPGLNIRIEPRGITMVSDPPVATRWFNAFVSPPPQGGLGPRQKRLVGALFPALRRILIDTEDKLPDPSWEAWRRARAAAAPREAASARSELTADVLRSFPRDGVPRPGEEAEMAHILRITFDCNQSCAFCFVDLSKKVIGLEEIDRCLESIPRAKRGTDELSLSGGDPAAHPRLGEIVALARAKGFKRIVIQTNAVLLSRRGFVRKLGPLGYFVSFHSHVPEIYDRLTSSRSQFPSAVKGLGEILRLPGNSLTVNILVTALNYARLPEHVAFIDRLRGVHPVSLSFSMLNHVGLRRTPELAVDLSQARPFLVAAVSESLKRGLHVASFDGAGLIPVCLFEAPPSLVSRGEWSQDDVRYQDDFAGCDARGTAKSPSCKSCAFDRSCQGVPVLYAQRFGLSALTPIRRV